MQLITIRDRLVRWARAIKSDVIALTLAARDPRVPLAAKLAAAAIAAYALSPIDLIPDFIPVIGYLDELILLPLAIKLAVRLIPAELMAEHRRAAADIKIRPISRAGAVAIVAIWLIALWAAADWLNFGKAF